ncbi:MULTISPECIES: protein-disulfide reductase DsbD family protein [Vibrio]|uniref:protein-disulfide reductase DsbD family protein n=1 Tax=Vibrio TaxID=662 RepID=UPI002075F2C5|nr:MULTISPECIES: protein-disulfide reductase DsbD domain-containing protein [Vibrio]USD34406.1 thioredoxin family protein [Vibrio sp. SCSIO 43186]USD47477.1 thioredoxin family protein [Vibrio sp. SCSIO 43145]USD71531.1 thioredoxin family protein [Vibrio sp. SCSIO 43139]USD98440.1 cytochrome C biogenesis protein [Vibrio coralliilyticus]
MRSLFKGTAVSIISLLLALSAVLSMAYASTPVDTGWMSKEEHPPLKTRFVLTGQIDESAKTVEGLLEVELDDDWKTYWRSPGEGGIAPSIDWGESTNLANVKWHWPYPDQFSLLGINTLGYKEKVTIPMTLQVEDFSQPVSIDANLTMSSCTTICVLTDYPFSLTFMPSDLMINQEALYKHAQAISQVPKSSPLLSNATATWDTSANVLQVKMTKALGWQEPELIVDGHTDEAKEYSYKLTNVNVDENTVIATFEVSSWLGEIEFDDQSVFVTVKDKNFLAEQDVVVVNGAIVKEDISLLPMIGFALFGGLILNVMPCVLPVLGMKLSSIVAVQGVERRQIRWQFLASSAGILTSFWLLAAFLLVLKLTGNAVGWGIQFQSGWFLAIMVLVTGLFGANMLGLFEIRLSSQANTWAASKGDNSYTGHFTQGMFATLLATPCSAPFLGTAVAFALAASSLELLAIFTALALGMALPWIGVALFPGIANLLPKPGAWMNQLKLLFGIMMLMTSVWLLSLLNNHIPSFWIVLIALPSVVLILARVKKVYGDKAMAISGSAAVLLLAGGFVLASLTTEHWATPLPNDLVWQPLSDERIHQAVEQGQTVFVNVTADWCVTCKANEIGVILQDPVYPALKHPSMTLIEGDWTHPDGSVTDYLRANGRFGVPFNIVYGPEAPQGIPLPVILSSDAVMEAIATAGGNR